MIRMFKWLVLLTNMYCMQSIFAGDKVDFTFTHLGSENTTRPTFLFIKTLKNNNIYQHWASTKEDGLTVGKSSLDTIHGISLFAPDPSGYYGIYIECSFYPNSVSSQTSLYLKRWFPRNGTVSIASACLVDKEGQLLPPIPTIEIKAR